MSNYQFTPLVVDAQSVLTLPIKHLSVSALGDLMRSRNLFIKKWIR